uniref:Ion transport protein n=1 Tax=Haloquadratum walsbyi TaxID=293091 RepID=Q2LGU3_9EURY|nr:ion transport protein [Haloquadratum walsbyi]
MNYTQARSFTYEIFAPRLGGRLGAAFDWGIMGLIVINIIAVLLETVDPIAATYGRELYLIEIISVSVFTIEYLAHVWSIIETRKYDNPILGRIRFTFTPLMIIDLLAILPFYLASIFAVDTRFLRAMRLVRVIRLLKIARYSESIRSFATVLRSQKEKLVVAAAMNLILLVLSSSIMYQLEHNAQPELFSSIPATLWWGAMTLTTVGYGDMYPVTQGGQVAGSLIAVFGIGLFALPASILAAGFIEDSQATDDNVCPHCGEELSQNK